MTIRLNTYVINLDGSTERLQSLRGILDGFGIGFERVSAVDGRKFDLDKVADYDSVAASRYMGRALIGGEIGCFHSHLKAARTFLASDADYALILEDDALPLCNPLPLLEAAIPDLNAIDRDWILINIGNPRAKFITPIASYKQDEADHTLVAAHYFPMLTSAIVWSRKGAQQFVDRHRQIFAPIDNYFRHWLTRAGHGYAFLPSPVTTSDAESLIEASAARNRSRDNRMWYYGFAKQSRLMQDKILAWRHKRRFARMLKRRQPRS
jgi:glycosyl transferase family 25